MTKGNKKHKIIRICNNSKLFKFYTNVIVNALIVEKFTKMLKKDIKYFPCRKKKICPLAIPLEQISHSLHMHAIIFTCAFMYNTLPILKKIEIKKIGKK